MGSNRPITVKYQYGRDFSRYTILDDPLLGGLEKWLAGIEIHLVNKISAQEPTNLTKLIVNRSGLNNILYSLLVKVAL